MPIWGRQDPGGPHVGPMNFAIWDCQLFYFLMFTSAYVEHFMFLAFAVDAWQLVAGSQLRVMGQLWVVDMHHLGLWGGDPIQLIQNRIWTTVKM